MNRSSLKPAVLFALLAITGKARADDTDIFSNPTVQPNVVILVDTSGSMADTVNGEVKMTSAKTALTALVQSIAGMNYGLFRFNSNSTGGYMVAPVGSTTATMVTAINGLQTSGSTPLGRAANDVEEYYYGTFSQGTVSGSGNGWSGGGNSSDECEQGNDDSHGHHGRRGGYGNGNSGSSGWNSGWSSNGGTCSITDTFASPILYECQKNFLIIMTDGMPNGEDTNLVTDVATSLYTNDHSSTLTGTQNVLVYTIGYATPEGTTLLQATAAAGGGQFYTVGSASDLSQALSSILSDVATKVYTFDSPVIPSVGTAGAGKAYMCSFDPDPAKPYWQGYVKAYNTNSAGLIATGSDGKPDISALAWEAGALLAAKVPSTRNIFTYFSGASQSFTTSNASITTAMLGLSTSTDRTKLINYIRGIDAYDDDLDGNTTENRTAVLGDPFHSTPALVVPPPGNSSDSTYTAFKTAQASRTKVLIVGANDGMIHGFRESDGQELWGFIPYDEIGNLKNMRPSSVAHVYFVDSSPIVTDVKIGTTWKTIAVFGERKGGVYYQALDVTDPTNPSFLWSFTDTRMGETWSEPAIGLVKMSDATVRYVAFVGGGYNSSSNNSTGKAVFAINLADGTKLWQYYNTGSGSNDDRKMNFSIAGSPVAIDLDGDGDTDRVYVADVGGQVWKFDVSANGSPTTGLVTSWTGMRLFMAAPTQTNPPASGAFAPVQAMYNRPSLAYDANGALWLYIGTGDRNNPNSTSSNYFFGIKENTTMTNGTTLQPSSLVDAPATNASIVQGWKLAMSSSEKVLSDAEINNGAVYFTTYIPNSTASCANPGGVARLYAVQMGNGDAAWDWANNTALTGENSSTRYLVIGSGIPSRPTTVQGTNNDAIIIQTTDGQVSTQLRPRAAGKRVRYWKEVY
jgi:type IV pilus assembly protein PilY1